MFFLLDAGTRKLFVSFNYHVLLGETVHRILTSQFATYYIYMCFLFDAGIKKLFVSFDYHILLGKYYK